MHRRSSGILLHPTCLPGSFGIGDLGPWAYRFVDFLAKAKQGFWQILPLTPTDKDHYDSPYYSVSAFAGNPLLISPELLMNEGLLTEADLMPKPNFPDDYVDFGAVTNYKERLLQLAYQHFTADDHQDEFDQFCRQNTNWLDDFVLFEALRYHYQRRPWNEWPEELRNREPEALETAQNEFADSLRQRKFRQFIFFRQWHNLKQYCHQKHLQIIGDIPIYLPFDSADVWIHPDLFKLGDDKNPHLVSGVPPDYFSDTGQLWGHPVYNWEVLKKNGYAWWIRRLEHNFDLFDVVRIDHFRGLVAYWEIPATEKTAINGQWIPVPIDDFFNTLMRRFRCLPIIAEDLGLITSDVREIMQRYQLPGMRVLLFAFGEDFPSGSFLPHNHGKDCLIYTGTHDNNTVRGWFENEATAEEKKRLFQYLGYEVPIEKLPWEMVRLAMMSVANTAIIPMQDILMLGAQGRMNDPSRKEGNWRWRLAQDPITSDLTNRLLELTEIYGRA